MSKLNINQFKERCLASYADMCELLQDDGWFDPTHRRLCNFIQYHYEQYMAGKQDTALKIGVVMARGTLKTTIVTKYFPIWLAINDPNFRTLVASNTMNNARKKLRDIRGVFDSHELFRAMFPEFLHTSEAWNNESACIPRTRDFPESTFEASGMKTKKTGTHYNLILEDDTVAPDESDTKIDITVPSRTTIEKGIGWHKGATALLVPKGVNIRIVVSTRWAEEDLIHHIRGVEHYKMFDVPALDGAGVPKFTNFYGVDKLADIRESIGDYMFSCLYLNAPLDASLRIFQSQWFTWIPQHQVPADGYLTIAIDPAISKHEDSCETSITMVQHSVHRNGRAYQYWVHDEAGHFSPFKTAELALNLCEANDNWKRLKVLMVENNAYQDALCSIIRDELIRRNNLRLEAGQEEMIVQTVGSPSSTHKDIRIQGMQPAFENGRILWVKGAVSEQTESQLTQYPTGRLRDRIDCFAMHRYLARGEQRVAEVKHSARMLPQTLEAIKHEIRNRKRGQACYSKPVIGSGMATGLGSTHDMRLEAHYAESCY